MDGKSNLQLLSICQNQRNSIKNGREENCQKITVFKFLNHDKKYIFSSGFTRNSHPFFKSKHLKGKSGPPVGDEMWALSQLHYVPRKSGMISKEIQTSNRRSLMKDGTGTSVWKYRYYSKATKYKLSDILFLLNIIIILLCLPQRSSCMFPSRFPLIIAPPSVALGFPLLFYVLPPHRHYSHNHNHHSHQHVH